MILGIIASTLKTNYGEPEYDYIYTLQMVDSFGDGWNGNYLTVSLNGNYVHTITLNSGSNGVDYFGANHGDLVRILYHNAGRWPEEVGFSIPELGITFPVGSFPMPGGSTSEVVLFQAPDTVIVPAPIEPYP